MGKIMHLEGLGWSADLFSAQTLDPAMSPSLVLDLAQETSKSFMTLFLLVHIFSKF